jgi:UDP-3-O-[3-hydroxymyristoyl] glucosamine N-acyltransferase
VASAKWASRLLATRASAVIVAHSVETPLPSLLSDNPYLTFARAVAVLHPQPFPSPGVHPTAVVDPSAVLGERVHVGAFAVVGPRARIGARSVLHPHVVLYADVELGEDCLLHSGVQVREACRLGHRVIVQNGAVIGADGFGFAKDAEGRYHKIPQVGTVVIEDDVEIGANATVDRPAVGETRIGAGTKIDNLVQVAHGVRIGRNVLLAAQVGIAGSSVIEDQVTLAGQVGVAGHLTIGKGVIATAQTGIPNSVESGGFISGYPAIPNRDWLRASAVFRKLPELRKLVADLERRIAELEAEAARKP